MTACSRRTCDMLAIRRGLCGKHYRHWRRLNARVPVAVVRAHIAALNAAGVNTYTVAREAGLHFRSVYSITAADRRDQTTVRGDLAHAILSVAIPARVIDLETARLLPIVGTQRRLRALVALGYTNLELAAGIGMRHQPFCRLLNHRGPYVTADYAHAAADLFDRLQLLPPPDGLAASRSRLRAQRKGWALPFAWDEDAIDNPAAKPVRITKRGGTAVERIIELRDHVGVRDYQEIAERLGIQRDSVMETLRRAREQVAS